MERKRLHSLLRVKFSDPLRAISGYFLSDSVTPGGALFPKTHLEAVDIQKRTLIFKPGCRVSAKGFLGRFSGVLCFSFPDGLHIIIAASKVKKVDRIKVATASRIPAPLRDRECLFVTVPDRGADLYSFKNLIQALQKNGDVFGIKEPRRGKVDKVDVQYFELLIKKERRKAVSELILCSGVIPSGRAWMLLTCSVFSSELAGFAPA